MEDKYEYREQLKAKTKDVALRVIKLYQSLPKTTESQVIGKQILRSGTSVAANYRAVCRARSGAEFHSKLSIVIEETDETLFWLEILWESDIIKKSLLEILYSDMEDLLKQFVVSRKSSRNHTSESMIQ